MRHNSRLDYRRSILQYKRQTNTNNPTTCRLTLNVLKLSKVVRCLCFWDVCVSITSWLFSRSCQCNKLNYVLLETKTGCQTISQNYNVGQSKGNSHHLLKALSLIQELRTMVFVQIVVKFSVQFTLWSVCDQSRILIWTFQNRLSSVGKQSKGDKSCDIPGEIQ